MSAKIFIDTNLWVYLYAKSPEEKYIKIRRIISEQFQSVVISTQILGELYTVLTRKKIRTQEEAKEIILEMITTFPVVEIDALKVLQALNINTKYGYSYWDSLIISTALANDCNTLYSEDMQHNQVVDKVQIVNPYS
jgi:predicted nucleic acid-binding protein